MEGISFTIPGLEIGQTYRIRYRLKNRCEQGKASPEFVVSLADTPGQMKAVQTKLEGCAVRLTWEKPSNGGSTITSFLIGVATHKEKTLE